MKVAVVGAGWAGLAAASQLNRKGVTVTLYDASHQAGGRARGVSDPELGELDNGQHLFIGAYQATLRLMRDDLGDFEVEQAFLRQPLALESVGREFKMCVNDRWPAFLQNACALWLAKGLSLKDKWLATHFLRGIQTRSNHPTVGTTVSQWLDASKQTDRNCQWLWHPLCLATMNTDPRQACASLFCNVLSDSLLNSTPGSTDLLIPRKNLSQIWPQSVAANVHARWGQVVRQITLCDQQVSIEGDIFDACVLAVPPANLKRIIEQWSDAQALTDVLDSFQYRAITTCYMELDTQLKLPSPLLMFKHDSSDKNIGQWVFDRNQFMSPAPRAQLAFVVSDPSNLHTLSDLKIGQALLAQLTQALSLTDPPKIRAARCFHEKRATFAALPGQRRPQTRTPWPSVFLAGDWTDTGYPAVIEGAVRSGNLAATAILQQHSSRRSTT